MSPTVLFLCTGNYYRSRFAEALFNDLAARRGLRHVAASRGLATERGTWNVGPISKHALRELRARGIAVDEPIRLPRQCAEADLAGASRVIALKEAEHRPYLLERFPDWPDRVDYWHVHDLDQAEPEQALADIAARVTALVEELETNRGIRTSAS